VIMQSRAVEEEAQADPPAGQPDDRNQGEAGNP